MLGMSLAHIVSFKMAGPFLEVLASDLRFDVGHTGNGDAASSTSQGKCGGQWGIKKGLQDRM